MPVPTDTLWNIRKLNVIFAVSALLLLGSMVWLIKADHDREWRQIQQDGWRWDAAMTRDAEVNALTAQQITDLKSLRDELARLDGELKNETKLNDLRATLDSLQKEKGKKDLKLRVAKGEITPQTQLVEEALLSNPADSPLVQDLKQALAKKQADYAERFAEMAQIDLKIDAASKAITAELARKTEVQKKIDDLTRKQKSAQDKLAKLEPSGLTKIAEAIRNAPLSDWFNPSEKVDQVVVPDIRTDLNFLTVETVDRCKTCHVNIDNPRYELPALLSFVERQVAVEQGQDVVSLADPLEPTVMLGFWVKAAKALAAEPESLAAAAALKAANESALSKVNELRAAAGLKALDAADRLVTELERIAREQGPTKHGETVVTRSQWYEPVYYFMSDLKALLKKGLNREGYAALLTVYRQALVQQYNEGRARHGQKALDAGAVLLAHPDLHLYVDAESKHPMKSMGCTVCHEGSGQETQFIHTVHTPRRAWVDAQSGAVVPEFLLHAGEATGHKIPGHVQARTGGGLSLDGAQPALAAQKAGESDAGHAETAEEASVYSHFDVKLTEPGHPAPFSPQAAEEAHEAVYLEPASGQVRRAVPQEEFWTRAYGWEEVHYMHWEKPMHRLDYIESSCARCHSRIYDIRDEAPRLFEGRKLFAQLGCVNCHQVDALKEAMDVKRVGPSLAHVKEKLSPEMMASWIWSPKAFRPMTRMPHFFLLENNSAPVDLLRTRTEVAAMTHYLLTAAPGTGPNAAGPYQPQAPPKDAGDAKKGQQIFNTVGCLACHTNMAEFGQRWIVDDLIKREGLGRAEAKKRAAAMSYNQQHWYALEHLQDKLILIGPELSGVGTKLKAGRTEGQARAWAFNWVSNPRHYSGYSIMPSFRLSEGEANDVAAYLLTLERPGYKPEDFLSLDGMGEKMLRELAANFKAVSVPLDYARQVVDGDQPDPDGGPRHKWTRDEQLAFVGRKAIAHYGCNGCHQINGFESAAQPCAQLDEWGLKDPHKLDFGYFDHAYDKERESPLPVWKVAHEGLDADAPRITATDTPASTDNSRVHRLSLKWEEIPNERRPWLYNKLHNTRIYDRGRGALNGKIDDGKIDIGKPYDKLKMPKFFLADAQVRALVTFVTSLRKPLVSEGMLAKTYGETRRRIADGRQLATMYNCYGCHNVEANSVHLHEFLPVHNPDGSTDNGKLNDFAPPRLIAEGSRTQPDWLHEFLLDVRPIRPWLNVRMPSFPTFDHPGGVVSGSTPAPNDSASYLVEYFAAATQTLQARIGPILKPIDEFITNNPSADWFANASLHEPTAQLRELGLYADLVKPSDLDPRLTSLEDRRESWGKLLANARFLRDDYTIHFPFPAPPHISPTPDAFARGEALYGALGCKQCHTLGDERLLAQLKAKLGQPAAPTAPAAEDDGYSESTSAKPSAAAASDDGYGEETKSAAAEEEEGPDLNVPMLPQTVTLGGAGFAPNLGNAARRIQYNWAEHWVQAPGVVHVGTRMPSLFPMTGESAFVKEPEEARKQKEAIYGYTGAQQRQFLLGFIYAAGQRNYTPGAEQLSGSAPPQAPLSFTPLAAPAVTAAPAPKATPTTPAAAPATAAAAPPPTPMEPPKPEPAVSTIELQDQPSAPYTGTRIVGVIKFSGKAPPRRFIDMTQDPACAEHAAARPLYPFSQIVKADGSMQSVFVYVKSGLAATNYAVTADAVIDQHGCEYHPHVVGVMVNQPLQIKNSDSTTHNIHARPAVNKEFNESMGGGVTMTKKFNKAEMALPLACDIHPWMSAYVYVTPHPFFAVTDVQGRYEIKGLPPGKYTLEALVEPAKDFKVAPATFEVTVEANTSLRQDATLERK